MENQKSLIIYFSIGNNSGKKSREYWLKENNFILYSKIINFCLENNLDNISFKQKIYHFVYNLKTIPVCLTCGKEVKYLRFKSGYQKHCCEFCANNSKISKEKWKKSYNENKQNHNIKNKRDATVIKKYGDVETYQKILNEKRISKTLEKYNCQYYFQTDEFKKNRKSKLKEKYNDENYNNKEKTKNTRIKNKTQINDDDIECYLNYKKIVIKTTIKIYKKYKNIINPNNLKRGFKFYHIDHIYSIKQGFINNIPIDIITNPNNLRMIWWEENIKKQDRCDIKIEELVEKINHSN
jgi:hypothetical protein